MVLEWEFGCFVFSLNRIEGLAVIFVFWIKISSDKLQGSGKRSFGGGLLP